MTTENRTMNTAAIRFGLSPAALECLDAAVQLGAAPNPLALWAWACLKAVDPKQPAARQAAARELADRIAVVGLTLVAWT